MKQFLYIIFSALFITSSASSIAQKQKKYFIEAAPGVTIPVGKFINKSWNENTSLSNAEGLAKAGFDINLSGGWQVNKSIGVLLAAGFSTNKQDANSFRNYLTNKYGAQAQTSVATESWNIFKVMGGPSFNTPLADKSNLIFRAKLLAGASKTSIPGYAYSYAYIDPVSNLQRAGMANFTKISLPWFFCWQATAGIKYKTSKGLYVFSEAGYFHATLNYRYIYLNPVQGGFFNGSKKIEQSYIGLYAGAGIDL